jgi:benzoyl-CoA reductase subunit C
MLMPKDENNKLLNNLIKQIPNRSDLPKNKGPRLHISGSLVSDLELFELVEECGGMVVSDDLCIGSRYFWEPVDNKLDPVEALARHYLNKVACPCMHTPGVYEERFNFMLEQIKRYKVDGVIFCLQKYCDAHQYHHPILVKMLEKEGIPVLNTEVEQNIGAAQLRTKLQAFIETIGG